MGIGESGGEWETMLHHVTFRLVHEVERDRMRTSFKVCHTRSGYRDGHVSREARRLLYREGIITTGAFLEGACRRLWKGKFISLLKVFHDIINEYPRT